MRATPSSSLANVTRTETLSPGSIVVAGTETFVTSMDGSPGGTRPATDSVVAVECSLDALAPCLDGLPLLLDE